ncbi:MAG: glycerol-3-phosphate 1-O-acyltransferase PlsY [Gammaproteobacteria bacterium]|nr:glycerol-3-phosphate 1-O-acyltransferase PlsY [Gammaproteobacteria bacterium]
MTLLDISLILSAYLLGSISSAIVICRLAGLPDPRTAGSNNPGATNVLRLGSKKAAAFTLLGDMLKGLIPTLLAVQLNVTDIVLATTAFAAFVGHLYPVFFRFQGGKGVATALGVLLGMSWLVGGLTIITWVFCAFVTRISSLSALIAFSISPVYTYFVTASAPLTLVMIIITAALFWRHSSNIKNLRAGTEGKIGDKKT